MNTRRVSGGATRWRGRNGAKTTAAVRVGPVDRRGRSVWWRVGGVVAAGLLVLAPASAAFAETSKVVVDAEFNSNVASGLGGVYGLAVQGDGKIVAGGESGLRVTRMEADGSPDIAFIQNLGSGFNSAVTSVAIQPDGKVVAGGYFTAVNGVSSSRLARLNADGTVDTAFSGNLGAGFDAEVLDVVVEPDGSTLVGGRFTTLNGQTARRLVRLLPDGTPDTAFNANVEAGLQGGFNNPVQTISLQPDGKILVGGDFQVALDAGANRITRLNPDGTRDTSFVTGTGFDNQVIEVQQQPDGKILVAGSFTAYNGMPAPGLARLNADGSLDTTFMANFGGGLGNGAPSTFSYSIAVQPGGGILVVGNFQSVDGHPSSRIARLHPDGTLDTDFNVGTGLTTLPFKVLALDDRRTLVGMQSGSFDGVLVGPIAKLVNVTVTAAALPDQLTVVDVPFVVSAAAVSDPAGEIVFSAAGLPAGVNIDPTTGEISGTPTAVGTYTVTVSATSDGVTDTASFVWTVIAPGVDIEKHTNGDDAGSAPGPFVPAGEGVQWSYTVTNTGDAELTDVTVTDDLVAAADIDCDDTGSNTVPGPLLPGAAFTCTATGTASAGQYSNTGMVTADHPAQGQVSDQDASHYFGAAPGVSLQQTINGVDADNPPGPVIANGSTVHWTYTIINTGNTPLTDITVIDNQFAPSDIDCDSTGTNTIPGPLAPGSTIACTATSAATPGPYASTSTVTATSPDTTDTTGATSPGSVVTASDTAHYLGLAPADTNDGSLASTGGITPTLTIIIAAALTTLTGLYLTAHNRRKLT